MWRRVAASGALLALLALAAGACGSGDTSGSGASAGGASSNQARRPSFESEERDEFRVALVQLCVDARRQLSPPGGPPIGVDSYEARERLARSQLKALQNLRQAVMALPASAFNKVLLDEYADYLADSIDATEQLIAQAAARQQRSVAALVNRQRTLRGARGLVAEELGAAPEC